MTWNDITREVTKQLLSKERNLATDRRLKALESISNLIPNIYKEHPQIMK